MITHLLDRVRSERDRRNWNHAVRYARPGDHATATVIGPGWITWTSGPIRRNPAECPWPDATDAEAESVPLASITAARLGWVTAVTR